MDPVVVVDEDDGPGDGAAAALLHLVQGAAPKPKDAAEKVLGVAKAVPETSTSKYMVKRLLSDSRAQEKAGHKTLTKANKYMTIEAAAVGHDEILIEKLGPALAREIGLTIDIMPPVHNNQGVADSLAGIPFPAKVKAKGYRFKAFEEQRRDGDKAVIGAAAQVGPGAGPLPAAGPVPSGLPAPAGPPAAAAAATAATAPAPPAAAAAASAARGAPVAAIPAPSTAGKAAPAAAGRPTQPSSSAPSQQQQAPSAQGAAAASLPRTLAPAAARAPGGAKPKPVGPPTLPPTSAQLGPPPQTYANPVQLQASQRVPVAPQLLLPRTGAAASGSDAMTVLEPPPGSTQRLPPPPTTGQAVTLRKPTVMFPLSGAAATFAGLGAAAPRPPPPLPMLPPPLLQFNERPRPEASGSMPSLGDWHHPQSAQASAMASSTAAVPASAAVAFASATPAGSGALRGQGAAAQKAQPAFSNVVDSVAARGGGAGTIPPPLLHPSSEDSRDAKVAGGKRKVAGAKAVPQSEGDPTWYGPSSKRVRGRDSVPPGESDASVPASRPLRAAAAGPSTAPSTAPEKMESEDQSRAVPLEEENALEADRYIEEADKVTRPAPAKGRRHVFMGLELGNFQSATCTAEVRGPGDYHVNSPLYCLTGIMLPPEEDATALDPIVTTDATVTPSFSDKAIVPGAKLLFSADPYRSTHDVVKKALPQCTFLTDFREIPYATVQEPDTGHDLEVKMLAIVVPRGAAPRSEISDRANCKAPHFMIHAIVQGLLFQQLESAFRKMKGSYVNLVLTVPHKWNIRHRRVYKKIVEDAATTVLGRDNFCISAMLSEPVAAAFHAICDGEEDSAIGQDGPVLVLDFGAGTVDAALLEVTPTADQGTGRTNYAMSVLAYEGVLEGAGGFAVTEALRRGVVEYAAEQAKTNPSYASWSTAFVYDKAEEFKIRVSREWKLAKDTVAAEVSRTSVLQVPKSVVRRALAAELERVRSMMLRLKATPQYRQAVDPVRRRKVAVLMVGKASKLPLLEEVVRDCLGADMHTEVHESSESVVRGAAYYAAALSDPYRRHSLLTDIAPSDLRLSVACTHQGGKPLPLDVDPVTGHRDWTLEDYCVVEFGLTTPTQWTKKAAEIAKWLKAKTLTWKKSVDGPGGARELDMYEVTPRTKTIVEASARLPATKELGPFKSIDGKSMTLNIFDMSAAQNGLDVTPNDVVGTFTFDCTGQVYLRFTLDTNCDLFVEVLDEQRQPLPRIKSKMSRMYDRVYASKAQAYTELSASAAESGALPASYAYSREGEVRDAKVWALNWHMLRGINDIKQELSEIKLELERVKNGGMQQQ